MERKKQYILYGIFLFFLGIRFLGLPLFFREKIKLGNISFYGSEEIKKYKKFEQIVEEMKENPFYDSEKNIKIYFCDTHFKYFILNPLYKNSLAITFCIGPYRTIICNKTDFVMNIICGSEKEYNTRLINQIISHEATHAYITKGISVLNRFIYQPWVEEGIAEYISQSSTFEVKKGVENLLSGFEDKRSSFRYLKYRIAVSYLINVENKKITELLSEKRRLSEILKLVKNFDKDEIYDWLENY